jgi:hypothetical protein
MSPYVFYYDMIWAGLAVGWLALLGATTGFRSGEREILLAAWLTPLLMLPVYSLTGIQFGFVVLVLLFAVALRRAVPIRAALSSAVP